MPLPKITKTAKNSYAKSPKTTAKKAVTKATMTQDKKVAREMDSTRRKLARRRDKFEKLASETTGITAERYKRVAEELEVKRQGLYKNYNIKQDESRELKSDIAEVARTGYNATLYSSVKQLLTKSEDDLLSEALLSSSTVGSTFYGGLVQVWEDVEGDVNEIIKDYFNASSIAEVMQMLEDAGINIYKVEDNSELYTLNVLKIQQFVTQYGR